MSDTNFGLVANVQSTFMLLKDQRRDEALMLFNLGAMLNKSTAGVTIAAIAEQTGVSKNRLKMCSKLAEALKNDLEIYKVEFDKIELATFDKLYAKFVTNRVRKKPSSADRLRVVLKQMELDMEDADTRYFAIDALKGIRRRINNHIPPELTLADKEYIKYYECTACGSYPPPDDGYEITYVDDVPVPVCGNCLKTDEHISMKRVAKMYHNYSIQMSRLIIAGALDINEEDLNEEAVLI